MGREKPIKKRDHVKVMGEMRPIYDFYYNWEDYPCLVRSVNKDKPEVFFPWAQAFIYVAGKGLCSTYVSDVTWKGKRISKERYEEMVNAIDKWHLEYLLGKENEEEYEIFKKRMIEENKEVSWDELEKKNRWSKREKEKLATYNEDISGSDLQEHMAEIDLWEKLQNTFWSLAKKRKISPQQMAVWLCDLSGNFKDKEMARIIGTTELNVRRVRRRIKEKLIEAIKINVD